MLFKLFCEALSLVCCITDLRKKEVINIRNGLRVGFVSDVEIDLCNARIVSIIIYGKLKFFGLLEDMKIFSSNGKMLM